MLSYANVSLIHPTDDLQAHVTAMLDPRTIPQWAERTWPDRGAAFGWKGRWPTHPFRFGTLVWPSGASRFSYGHYLVDEPGLKDIRDYVYSASGSYSYRPADLVIADGKHTVTTSMWMLPPRALDRVDRYTPGLYLLTLVDERFFWWYRGGTLSLNGSTTFAEAYSQMRTLLELPASIQYDDIHADYSTPSTQLASSYRPAPLILDALAAACGQRIVRRLDGTVYAMSASESLTRMTTNLALENTASDPQKRLAGHEYDFANPAGPPGQDLKSLVPASVVVVTAMGLGGAESTTETVTLSSLSLAEYGMVGGWQGKKLLYPVMPSDASTHTAYARRLARDWYLWRLARAEARYEGILPWLMEGHTQVVEFEHGAEILSTRVYRGPFLDHEESPDEGDTSFLAMLIEKDHSLAPWITYDWVRMNDSSTGIFGGLTYSTTPTRGGWSGPAGPAYSTRNLDVPVNNDWGSGSLANVIQPKSIVRLRKGSGNFYLFEEMAWEDLFRLTGEVDGDGYAVAFHRYWDQDLGIWQDGDEVRIVVAS